MKTTIKQQKSILSIIKSEINAGNGIKTISALLNGYGNPDNVFIDDNKIAIRVNHDYTYLTAKYGY